MQLQIVKITIHVSTIAPYILLRWQQEEGGKSTLLYKILLISQLSILVIIVNN